MPHLSFPLKALPHGALVTCQCFGTGGIHSLNTRAVDFSCKASLWNGIAVTLQAPWARGLCEQGDHSLCPGNRSGKMSRSCCLRVLLIPAATALGVPSGHFTQRASITSALVRTCCFPVLQHPSGFWSIPALGSVALPSSLPCSTYTHSSLALAPDPLPKCCQRQRSWLRIPGCCCSPG